MAEYAPYSKINPQWTEFVEAFPEISDLDRVGIVERKRIFGSVEAQIPIRQPPSDIPEDAIIVTTFTVTARDGFNIPVRSYIPTASRHERPVLVYLHAGGFLFGELESGDLNCRVLAVRLNISIVNVGYRLAPTWPFPHGVNDAYDVTKWTAAHAKSQLGADPEAGFLVGGISSGANFAGVVAYTARDEGLSPPITGLWISIPVCIMPQAYEAAPSEWRAQLLSLEQNAENPLLTRKSLTDIQDIYGCPPQDTRISFLLNKSHTNLPRKAYFQICGRDPLRDEAFLWQKLLSRYSGTKSKIHLYSGMPHGFWRFLYLKASQDWLDDLVEGVRFLCGRQDPGEDTELIVKT